MHNSLTPDAVVPHPAFPTHGFVLGPLARIAPDWHDPLTGLGMQQLLTRHTRAKPVQGIGATHQWHGLRAPASQLSPLWGP